MSFKPTESEQRWLDGAKEGETRIVYSDPNELLEHRKKLSFFPQGLVVSKK